MRAWQRGSYTPPYEDTINRWKSNITPVQNDLPNPPESSSTRKYLRSPFREASPDFKRNIPLIHHDDKHESRDSTPTPSPRDTKKTDSKFMNGNDLISPFHELRFSLPSKPQHRQEIPTSSSIMLGSTSNQADIMVKAKEERYSNNLAIHPYFEQDRSKPQILIISNDDIGYYLSIDNAKEISKYIKDNVHASSRSNHIKPQIQTLKLEQANSKSLTLILTTLLQRERFIIPKSADPMVLIKLLPEALKVSNQYGFSRFFNSFTSLLLKLNSSPFVLYTAFTLNDDFPSAKIQSKLTIRPNLLNQIPPTIEKILRDNSPRYLRSLEKLHSNWSIGYNEMYHSFAIELNVNIRLEGFGSGCKKRFGRGCEGYTMFNASFTKLRIKAADAAAQTAKQQGYRSMNPDIEESIHNAVECQICAHRFINAFDAVMRKVFSGLSDTI